MTRSICACLLAVVFAAPGVSFAGSAQRAGSPSTLVAPTVSSLAKDVSSDATSKPGKSKKYKKKMSKQMNKRKRH